MNYSRSASYTGSAAFNLKFARDHPEEFLLAENTAMELTAKESAQRAYESRLPHFALSCDGPLLCQAIGSKEMYPVHVH